jgi:hypothetical protein
LWLLALGFFKGILILHRKKTSSSMTVTYLLTLHLHLMPTMSLSAAAQSPDPPPPSLPSHKDVLFNTAILLGHQDWFKLLQGDGTEMTITEKQVYLPTNPKPKKEVLHDCTCF